MKKRRELDALVNGKLGRRKMKKGHELLRNDTDSSEVEEFSMPEKTIIRKRSASRLCSMCIPVCGFFLLTACIVAIGGLVFVHIELKKDLDDLRTQINKVASGSRDNPDKFQNIHSQMQELTKSVKSLQEGFKEEKVNISELVQQFTQLRTASAKLTQNVGADHQLSKLPQKIQDLPKIVATLGSDLTTLQGKMDGLIQFKTKYAGDHEKLMERIKKLEARVERKEHLKPGGADSQGASQVTNSEALRQYLNQEVTRVYRAIDQVNSSVSSHVSQINAAVVRLNKLVNESDVIKQRLALLELQPAATGAPTLPGHLQTAIQEAVNSVLNQSSTGQQMVGLTQVHNEVNNMSQVLRQLRTKVDQLKSSGAGQGGSTAIAQDVSSLKDRALANTLNIKAINASVNHMTDSITLMKKEMQSHQSKISQLEAKEQSRNAGKDLLPSGGQAEKLRKPSSTGSTTAVTPSKRPQNTNIDNKEQDHGPAPSAGPKSNDGAARPGAWGPQPGSQSSGPAGESGSAGQPGQPGAQGQGHPDAQGHVPDTVGPSKTGEDNSKSPGSRKEASAADHEMDKQNAQQSGQVADGFGAQGPPSNSQTHTKNLPPAGQNSWTAARPKTNQQDVLKSNQQGGQNSQGNQRIGQNTQIGKNSQNNQQTGQNSQIGQNSRNNQQTGQNTQIGQNSRNNQQTGQNTQIGQNSRNNQQTGQNSQIGKNSQNNQQAGQNSQSNPATKLNSQVVQQQDKPSGNHESNHQLPTDDKNGKEQAWQQKSKKQSSEYDHECGGKVATAKPTNKVTAAPKGDAKTKNASTTVAIKPKPQNTRKTVSVSFIPDEKTLETHFHRWDKNDGDGKIQYEDMRGFLGPHIPQESILKRYDANHDGYYTMEEMKRAFGFLPVKKITASDKSRAPRLLPQEDSG